MQFLVSMMPEHILSYALAKLREPRVMRGVDNHGKSVHRATDGSLGNLAPAIGKRHPYCESDCPLYRESTIAYTVKRYKKGLTACTSHRSLKRFESSGDTSNGTVAP